MPARNGKRPPEGGLMTERDVQTTRDFRCCGLKTRRTRKRGRWVGDMLHSDAAPAGCRSTRRENACRREEHCPLHSANWTAGDFR